MTYRYLMRYIGALAMLAGTALQGVQAQVQFPIETTCKDAILSLSAAGHFIIGESYHPLCSGTGNNAWQRKVLESGDTICSFSIENDIGYKSMWMQATKSFDVINTGWSKSCPAITGNDQIQIKNTITVKLKDQPEISLPQDYIATSFYPLKIRRPFKHDIACSGFPSGYIGKAWWGYKKECDHAYNPVAYDRRYNAYEIMIPAFFETNVTHLNKIEYLNTHIITHIETYYSLMGERLQTNTNLWVPYYDYRLSSKYHIKRPAENHEIMCKRTNTANPLGYRIIGEIVSTDCGPVTNTIPNALLLKKIQDPVETICMVGTSTYEYYVGQTIPDQYEMMSYAYLEHCPKKYPTVNAWMIRKK